MAMAPLGFTVDTGPVAKALADLDKLTAATAKAEAGTKGLTAPTAAAASVTKQLGAASAQAATQMTLATNAVKANNAALAITNAQTAAAQQQMRNLAFQFQDIGTMLMAGQSPFMLLAQQLPQVTMYGGQLTGVMGALKSTMAGLFSPLGLLTAGFVLTASAALSYFTGANDEADEAAKVLEDQANLIERVADRWGDTIPALREYAKAIEEARDAADLQAGSQVVMNSYFDDIRKMMPEVNAELSRFAQQASSGGWGSGLESTATSLAAAYDELYSALQDATQAVQDGEDATEDFKRVEEALTDLLNNDAVGAHDHLADALADIRDNAGGAVEKLKELQNTLAKGPRLGGETLDEAQERFNFLRQFNERMNPEEFEDVRRGSRKPRERRARKTEAERATERYADMIRDAQQYIAMQELEQRALFMTEEAASALRYEQEMLNQAANDNIKLTPEMAAELRNLAADMAATEAETAKLQDAFDFTKDVAKGFFSDVMSGLEQGKSLWESFAQAGLNALQKIADKLLDMAMDQLIQNLLGSFMSAGGGGFKLPMSAPIPTPRPSFDGGGFTGYGARSGGVDGKGGFPAILHPNETVIDHTKQVANQNHANQNAPVNIQIINNTPASIRTEESSDGKGGRLQKVIIDEVVSGAMSEQGSMSSRAVGNRFGLRNRVKKL